jgi:hypothetical protein
MVRSAWGGEGVLPNDLLRERSILAWVWACQEAGMATMSTPVWRVSRLFLLLSREQLESISAARACHVVKMTLSIYLNQNIKCVYVRIVRKCSLSICCIFLH